jgi:peptidyl-prolyl cis-trans isomerase C
MLGLTVVPSLAQQSAPATPANPSQAVLAVVNGKPLTRMDFDQLIEQFRPDAYASADSNKGEIMRDLVTLELLAQEGARLRLDQDPEVQAQIRLRTKNILARAVVQKYIAERANVTEEAMLRYYEAAKEEYRIGEQVTASHILVKTEREAQEVLKELKRGKDFAEVARAKSIDSSASNGGNVGTFGRGEMAPEFENAVFALQVGEISGPVRTEFGYHIIKVMDRVAARLRPLEEVRDDIRETLIAQYVDRLIEELRRAARVQIVQPEYTFDEPPRSKSR